MLVAVLLAGFGRRLAKRQERLPQEAQSTSLHRIYLRLFLKVGRLLSDFLLMLDFKAKGRQKN